jgi:prepilin-type N-terminal cleavage/methylation domain-containing protein/prepilin-type processing-associated H-X9-DG protein
MNCCCQVRKTTGFTLIELLVVVAIVAIIAAILFPVFAGVRERGRRTVCQSNLKQLALAMQQYVQDNSETYPSTPNHWAEATYPYLKNVEVFRCPDHPTDLIIDQLVLDPLSVSGSYPVDYAYNLPRLYVFVPPYPTKTILGVHEANLLTPSTIWLNVDAGWSDSEGDHYFRVVPKTSCGREFYGSTLHSGAGNYSYLDGHVKWLTPEEAGEIECANGPLPVPFKD